jgi:hypothetical protein
MFFENGYQFFGGRGLCIIFHIYIYIYIRSDQIIPVIMGWHKINCLV